MGRRWRIAGIGGLVAIALGCGSGSQEPPNVSASDVKQQTREAAQAAVDYAATQRRELTARAQQAIADADGKLAEARKRLPELTNAARDRLEAAIQRADDARKSLGARLYETQKAGEEHWERERKRISDALAELDEARGEVAAALAGEGKKADES